MTHASVDPSHFFNWLCPDTLDGDWVIVHERPNLVMSRRTTEPEVLLLRVQYTLELSFADTAALMRPEVSFDPRRPDYDSGTLACGVERLLAPGDAVAWSKFRVGTKAASLGISHVAVLGQAAATPEAGNSRRPSSSATASLEGWHRHRWMFRQGFPAPGECSVVCYPIDNISGEIQEASGVIKALAAAYRPHHEHPDRLTAATEVRLLRRVPDWSIEHMAGYYLRKAEWVALYKLSPVYAEVSNKVGCYVVVGLGKLVRGPPLLPRAVVTNEGGHEGSDNEPHCFLDWEPADSSGNCASYFRAFLRLIGVDADVYETLDGRSLVYYQALFHRDVWDRAWAALRGPWRAQCTAYRKRHGGKCAPKLTAGVDPRFTQKVAFAASSSPTSDGAKAADPVPVVATFVHFTPPPGLTHPRSNSNPEQIMESVA